MNTNTNTTPSSEEALPALNDVSGNVLWLQAMRCSNRDRWSIDEYELLGETTEALQRLASAARPSTVVVDPIALHNGLHRMAAGNVGLSTAERTQLCNAARLLWGFAHGLTANRLRKIDTKH